MNDVKLDGMFHEQCSEETPCSCHCNLMLRMQIPCHITSIQRIYDDDSEEHCFYYPAWNITDEPLQCENSYQRSKVNRHGDLFLEISENAELESIFPDEVINADDYTVKCRS